MPSRKKSASIHLLNGTGKKQDNNTAPAGGGYIKKPDWLSVGAGKEWDVIVKSLSNILTDNDQMALSAYCELASEFKESPADFPTARLTQLRLLMADFGLTPASRENIPNSKVVKKENAFSNNGKPGA